MTVQTALSARLDGEEADVPDVAIEAHLAGCARCRTWAEAAVDVTREARLSQVAPMPDLVGPVLTALGTPARPRRSVRAARLALLLLGVLQVAFAVRLLVIGGEAASHVVREMAMWEAALGAGFVAAAAFPHLARGMAPLVAVFCVAVVGVAGTDLVHGHTSLAAEAYHLVAVAGLLLLLLVRGPRTGHRQAGRKGRGWAPA